VGFEADLYQKTRQIYASGQFTKLEVAKARQRIELKSLTEMRDGE